MLQVAAADFALGGKFYEEREWIKYGRGWLVRGPIRWLWSRGVGRVYPVEEAFLENLWRNLRLHEAGVGRHLCIEPWAPRAAAAPERGGYVAL